MTTETGDPGREKVNSRLPGWLRQQLKVRAAEFSVDIQDAVSAGITMLIDATSPVPEVDTSGGESYSTYLPVGQHEELKECCRQRGVSYVQGMGQAVTLWLDAHPSGNQVSVQYPRRIIVANQKGGVGKTTTAVNLGEALAESGARVLLVDYDPQGHLSKQLGVPQIESGKDSLARHMSGDAGDSDIRELIVVIEYDRFGGRLHVLPACTDAFLLDVRLSQVRGREQALERALEPIEGDYDFILVDCPPSLGLSLDAAIHYARRRHDEEEEASGVLIPVQAEDSSADAYAMLIDQISDLCVVIKIEVDYLGLVVNLYDGRRGYIATSSLENWQRIGQPRVVAIIPDLKEQREAVRKHVPLLAYEPDCQQAEAFRELARELS